MIVYIYMYIDIAINSISDKNVLQIETTSEKSYVTSRIVVVFGCVAKVNSLISFALGL